MTPESVDDVLLESDQYATDLDGGDVRTRIELCLSLARGALIMTARQTTSEVIKMRTEKTLVLIQKILGKDDPLYPSK